jgi:tetratricopeptide (TPR) repeat protein
MKPNLISCFTLLFGLLNLSINGYSQKNKSENGEREFNIQYQIYKKALALNDFAVARFAVYEMIELQPEKKNLRDTLLLLYFASGNYVQSLLLGKDLLQEKPMDRKLMEIAATSQEFLGMYKESLEEFEKLAREFGDKA